MSYYRFDLKNEIVTQENRPTTYHEVKFSPQLFKKGPTCILPISSKINYDYVIIFDLETDMGIGYIDNNTMMLPKLTEFYCCVVKKEDIKQCKFKPIEVHHLDEDQVESFHKTLIDLTNRYKNSVICAFNGFGFDFKYFYALCIKNNIDFDFKFLDPFLNLLYNNKCQKNSTVVDMLNKLSEEHAEKYQTTISIFTNIYFSNLLENLHDPKYDCEITFWNLAIYDMLNGNLTSGDLLKYYKTCEHKQINKNLLKFKK